jgi:hypothetical protein
MGKKLVTIDGKVEFFKKGSKLFCEGEQWTRNGKKAYSIEDTGDGYIFRDHFDNTKIDLNYSQAEGLAILMKSDFDLDRIKIYKEDK